MVSNNNAPLILKCDIQVEQCDSVVAELAFEFQSGNSVDYFFLLLFFSFERIEVITLKLRGAASISGSCSLWGHMVAQWLMLTLTV